MAELKSDETMRLETKSLETMRLETNLHKVLRKVSPWSMDKQTQK